MKSMKRLPKAGTNMMKQFLVGHRRLRDEEMAPAVEPGEGKVVKVDGETLGIYRDDDGEWHAGSGTCTYSGCTLMWNGAGESWDCPCDGSRYAIDGTVFDGPAQEALRQRSVSVSRS